MSGRRGSPRAAAETADPWQSWRDQRPPAEVLHLNSAAAGRSSTATLRAMTAYDDREAAAGSLAAEAAAQPVLEAGRAGLARLLGVRSDGVAFVASGTAALAALLSAWPLRAGDTVAVAASEWGRNLAAFGRHGLRITGLATREDGRVDLGALEALLASDPPAFVHLTQVASHRCLVQPVAAAAALCRAAGVPLWVDAAQALGHVDAASGADVLYATSRKWLTGPRGVGLLAVADRWWDILRVQPSPAGNTAGVVSPVLRLESREASMRDRVGLCTALQEYLAAGPEKVRLRLAEVGTATREVLGDLPGWTISRAGGPSSAITAVHATAGQDIIGARAQLLSVHGILTTAQRPSRAPLEMTGPSLRISPHVDCTVAELRILRDALMAVG